jgi:poly(3-hydroxybutyrate) depolymerase
VLYDLVEMNRAFWRPATGIARGGAAMFSSEDSWLSRLPGAAELAAGYELIYRLGKAYDKPAFGITSVDVAGTSVAIEERNALVHPFCTLKRFVRVGREDDVPVLVVAPLSGHHATLLRDTVRALLAGHEVYVTDWTDARIVPRDRGAFTLADYVAYLRSFIRHIGAERLHVVAVCQAAVPALAATALMSSAGEGGPKSLTLIGGPIDARRSPTRVNDLATSRSLDWFEANLIHTVPAPHLGRGRRVYPGFLQHASFVAMNPFRHVSSHWEFFQHLVRGDEESAESHRAFYDEYNAVLDMAGEYYLDSVRIVFQQHLLPRGEWYVGADRVAPEAISTTALLTIEGELDDISGLGQTRAAHDLCTGIDPARKRHITVQGAGHYGIFSGRRWREVVCPQVTAFMAEASQPSSVKSAAKTGPASAAPSARRRRRSSR